MPKPVIRIRAPILPRLNTLFILVDHFTLRQLIKVDETSKGESVEHCQIQAATMLSWLLMIKAAIMVMIFFETKQLPKMDLYRYSALVSEMTAIDPGVMAFAVVNIHA